MHVNTNNNHFQFKIYNNYINCNILISNGSALDGRVGMDAVNSFWNKFKCTHTHTTHIFIWSYIQNWMLPYYNNSQYVVRSDMCIYSWLRHLLSCTVVYNTETLKVLRHWSSNSYTHTNIYVEERSLPEESIKQRPEEKKICQDINLLRKIDCFYFIEITSSLLDIWNEHTYL